MTLRDTWQNYLEDPESADEGEFTPLLTYIEEIVTPEEAFSSLQGGVEMAKRCREIMAKCLFNGLYYLPDPAHAQGADRLKSWAENTVASMYDFLKENDKQEVSKTLLELPWQVTDDISQFRERESASYRHNAITAINRRSVRLMSSCSERLFGAREAVLGMTMDWYVTDHILSAAVPLPINYRPGFDIFIGGGQLAVLHEMILLHVPQDAAGV